MYQRIARQVEADRHVAGRRMRAKLVRRKDSMKSKFKLVKRDPAKVAQPGATRTGAKVEKTKAGKGQPGSSAGRVLGKTSGLGIAKFQNKTLAENLKKKLTDEQLAKVWRIEFPNAKATYTAETVRGVRNVFNKGKHGNEVPKTPVPEFNDEGEALPFWGERAAAKREAAESKATEKKAVKKLKKVKK